MVGEAALLLLVDLAPLPVACVVRRKRAPPGDRLEGRKEASRWRRPSADGLFAVSCSITPPRRAGIGQRSLSVPHDDGLEVAAPFRRLLASLAPVPVAGRRFVRVQDRSVVYATLPAARADRQRQQQQRLPPWTPFLPSRRHSSSPPRTAASVDPASGYPTALQTHADPSPPEPPQLARPSAPPPSETLLGSSASPVRSRDEQPWPSSSRRQSVQLSCSARRLDHPRLTRALSLSAICRPPALCDRQCCSV